VTGAGRIPALAILTICVFTLADFLQSGFLLFPFPVYKAMLPVVAVIMVIAARKKPGTADILLLGWTLALLSTSKLLLDIFMNENSYAGYQESLELDICYLVFSFLFGIWAVLLSWKNRMLLLKVAGSMSAIGMMTLFVLNYYDWAIIPFALWCISVFYRSASSGVSGPFTRVLVFVYLTAWLTGYIAGQSEGLRTEKASPVAYMLYLM
jgi:hypothetical protein